MNSEQKDAKQRQARASIKILALAGLLAINWLPSVSRSQSQQVIPEIEEPQGEQDAEDCVKCHLKVNPAVVAMFEAGTMGRPGVQNPRIYEEVKRQRAPKEETESRKGFLVRKGRITCVLCHGADHTTISETNGRVADAVCGGCHDAIDKEYTKGGGHSFDPPAENWKRALDNPEFAGLPLPILQLSRDLRFSQQGATEPPYFDHDPEFERSGLVLRNGCDSCHTRHLFSAAEARKPEACKTCHAGAGDSVFDAYMQSKHGSLYSAERGSWNWDMRLPEVYARGEYKAPTCAYCHMLVKERYGDVTTTHNMTRKAIWNRGLQPLLVDRSEAEEKTYQEYLHGLRAQSDGKRNEMVLVCRNCHSEKFAHRSLNAADGVKYNSDLLVLQARSIIDKLVQDGLLPRLSGLPSDGAPAPGAPRADLSVIQGLYLEMARRHNVRTIHGAFHQSPRDVLWNGYVVLRNDVEQIRQLDTQIRAKRGN